MRSPMSYVLRTVPQVARSRRFRNVSTLVLFVLGPILAVLTFLVISGPVTRGPDSALFRIILLFDLVYVLVVAALVLNRIFVMISARRAKSAGSRLHLRLTGVFTLVALLPTVLVAIFATLTINLGLEAWFSDRVRTAIGSALVTARAYEQEQHDALRQDIANLRDYFENELPQIRRVGMPRVLANGQGEIQRGLSEAYIIDGTAALRVRGDRSYLFYYDAPARDAIEAAQSGQIVLIEDYPNNELRALVKLTSYIDRYLYVTRLVDGQLLALLDNTQEMALLYEQQEKDRGKRFFEFGLIYLGFALILILASIWLGLWFAERLSRPVGRLAGAAQRVGAGDLDVQVLHESSDDEIAMLGRYFNQMTRQLKSQRDILLKNTQQIEDRQRLFDSVLSSVTSGVIGVDSEGWLDFINRAAMEMLAVDEAPLGRRLEQSVPEFAALLQSVSASDAFQEEIRIVRNRKIATLLLRFSKRRDESGRFAGYVISFDDVTNLVSAQRMAAWGDVARRIAHEVKNPLTPIKLSAERLQRKFGKLDGREGQQLIEMTDTIMRQTDDLRRIVDDFSKFARMPEPDRSETDICKILTDCVNLQSHALPDIRYVRDIPQEAVILFCDETLMAQVFTNLLKNAAEALIGVNHETLIEAFIRVSLRDMQEGVEVTISDNGPGWPQDRARLFEPYVTTRDAGTGLGLSIVKKIVEEHDGQIFLEDAPVDGATPLQDKQPGAMVRIWLARNPHKHTEISA